MREKVVSNENKELAKYITTIVGINRIVQRYWDNKLKPIKLETKIVNWLLAIPISESELQYKIKNGFDNLQNLFEKNEVDIFDLDRKSVLD